MYQTYNIHPKDADIIPDAQKEWIGAKLIIPASTKLQKTKKLDVFFMEEKIR